MSNSAILFILSLTGSLFLSACGETPQVIPASLEKEAVTQTAASEAEPPVMVGGRRPATPEASSEAEPPVMVGGRRPEIPEASSEAEPPVMVGGRRPATPEEQKQVIEGVMQARAKQQAEGLGTGSVKVNGAWNYSGYSYLSPNPEAAIEARLVAVDVTISGHTPFFDIDDIEIIDGITLVSYGSDPHSEFLKPDGTLMGADDTPAEAPGASRRILIYAFPKDTPRFHLYYWGKQLTRTPVEIGKQGLGLPYPPVE